jgi:UDP-N-acetylmuramoylalanine--D-glutamate ligase
MDFRGKKFLVVGLGKSGLAAARFLAQKGARVTVSDVMDQTRLRPESVRAVLALGAELETGGHRKETFLSADMIIVSPGVALDVEPLLAARALGIPIMGEMELAARQIQLPVVAVTGTNGKSTTTAFLGALMARAGMRPFVGGNIGTPLMEYLIGGQPAGVAVLEVSSFQLDTMETFCPLISVILNISPDHGDRYPNFDAYAQSKLKICRNQGAGHYVVLNDEDEGLRAFEPTPPLGVLRYGLEKKKHRQAFLENGALWVRIPGRTSCDFSLEKFRLPGAHNRENLLAAVTAGLAFPVAPHIVQETIDAFEGLPHRLEHVASVGGVDVYNDSKATNVDAASRSIMSFDRPIILIAGGLHKGGSYDPLLKAASGKVKKALFIGEARHVLAGSFEGKIPFSVVQTLEDAVEEAFSVAGPGDVILLAPACASFDMFSDYAHRGEVFKETVRRLSGGIP